MNIFDLEKSIFKTCAFFDLFAYPPTVLEIHKWLLNDEGGLDRAIGLPEIYNCLNQSDWLKTRLTLTNGFCHLAGREQIIATRLRRYLITHQKYRLAKKGLGLLARLPFIQGAYLCNNFGYNNLHSNSDIDLFIVVSPGRIFLARLLATIGIAFLGLRPSKQSQADKICLSFYASEKYLDFSGLKISDPDLYFSYWLSNLLPVFNEGSAAKLFSANSWLKKILPNHLPIMPGQQRALKIDWFSRIIKQSIARLSSGWLGDQFEHWAKQLQLNKISSAKRELAKTGDGRVIINDQIIKLHENDRRLDYLRRWQEKINSLINNASA